MYKHFCEAFSLANVDDGLKVIYMRVYTSVADKAEEVKWLAGSFGVTDRS
jgi:hypothetical protein